MSELPKKHLTRADIILLALLLCLTVFLFLRPLIFSAANSDYFTITTPDGTVSYPLGEDRTLEIVSDDITLKVHVAGGSVYVESADCPDKICEGTGSISKVGEAIVCIPARVVIRIGEGGQSDEDFIVG